MVDSHQKTYVGRNLIVIVAGDFAPAAAKARVTQTFGVVPPGAAYAFAAAPAAPKNSEPRVLLVDKPDATQTYFVIAQPGVRRSTPDRVPLILVAEHGTGGAALIELEIRGADAAFQLEGDFLGVDGLEDPVDIEQGHAGLYF